MPKNRKSRIHLTDQICNHLDETAPVETKDAYMPKKAETGLSFVDMVGEDMYFDEKAKKKSKGSNGGKSVGDLLILLITILGFIGFITIIVMINK